MPGLTTLAATLLLLLAPLTTAATAADGAANSHQTQLRHGTLLLSSIALLDTQANQTAGDSVGRCCLSLKAYLAPLEPTSFAQHTADAQPAHAGAAPSASFGTCSNSNSTTGCLASLQNGRGSTSHNPYQVALLLSAQPQLQPAPVASAGRPELNNSSATAQTDPSQPHAAADSHRDAGHHPANPAGTPALAVAAGTQHSSSDSTAPSPATASPGQHASLRQDMLVTVHAEQELEGQIYLAVMTQLVPAGAGVVKLAINMSHHTHTWTSPAALPTPAAAHGSGSTSDNSSTATPLPDQAQAATAAAAAADEVQDDALSAAEALPTQTDSNSTVCPGMPAQNSTTGMPGPADVATQAGAYALPGPASAAFLPPLLQARLTADPAVLATYLQTVLGFCTDTRQSPGSSRTCCSCPKLLDKSDAAAVDSWAEQLQEAVLRCPYDPSLSSHLAAAAAAAARPFPQADMQQQGWLAAVAAHPAVSAVLQQLAASGLPLASSATPEELLVCLAAAAALMSLLLCKACSRASSRRRQHRQPAAEPQQQHSEEQDCRNPLLQANPTAAAAAAAQDAWPPQQQDQYETLDDHMQDIDADIFGYGAPPASTHPGSTSAAAAAAAAGQPGGMLAAAQAVRRASAMAAGEAAGALKDAFMRRHTNSRGPAAAAAAAAGAAFAADHTTAAAAADLDWMNEEDEERVNQAPDSVQRQLAAGGRWTRDGEGRLVRGTWKAVRNSLAAAAQAVLGVMGSGGKAAAAAAGGAGAAGAAAGDGGDAAALQELLTAAPGAVVSFSDS